MSELYRIGKPKGAKVDVVFIHGLGDDPFACWQHDKSNREDSWPYWLATKHPDVAVWTLEYDAAKSYWTGEAMPLSDRAKGVLTTLELQGLGKRPIIFVCHSLGGLVAKQLLRTASDNRRPAWRALLEQTRDVFFLATPHAGSDLATWFDRLGTILNASAAIKDLKKNAPALRNLNEWYRGNSGAHGIESHVFYETQTTKGVLVVEESSADPGITDVVTIPIDADHIAIAKPDRSNATVCLYLLKEVEKVSKKPRRVSEPKPTDDSTESSGGNTPTADIVGAGNVTFQIDGDGNNVTLGLPTNGSDDQEAQTAPLDAKEPATYRGPPEQRSEGSGSGFLPVASAIVLLMLAIGLASWALRVPTWIWEQGSLEVVKNGPVLTSPKTAFDEEQNQERKKNRIDQERLKLLGHYNGLLDGKIGPMTRQAINEFQTRLGETNTGNLDENQRRDLKQIYEARSKEEPRRIGKYFKDVCLTECPEMPDLPAMMVVPAGTFNIGSANGAPDEKQKQKDEPIEFIKPFAIGRYEITRSQFSQFVSEMGDVNYSLRGCIVRKDKKWEEEQDRSWENPGYTQKDNHPVTCVSWRDAQRYVKWLRKVTKDHGYRLPSEAEWEYAARAKTTSAYYWGDRFEEDDGCEYANGPDMESKIRLPDKAVAKCNDRFRETAPVGSLKPNGFGLYDMSGNVWEWVEDNYHENYAGLPTDGRALSEENNRPRVLRGGSWFGEPDNLRSANRNGKNRFPDQRNFTYGFRVAKDLSEYEVDQSN